MTGTARALEAWGAYSRDDPFPLFSAVRELGGVHAVTLADGHDARRDFDLMMALFRPDGLFRALLPRDFVETRDARDAIGALRGWLEPHEPFHVLATEHHGVEGREFFLYRILLKPDWAPDAWHVIEQSGYCRVREGRITRLDLVCTGYHPATAPREPR